MPELRAIYEELHDRGFEVVGISLDESDVDLKDFVKKQSLPWPVLHETAPELTGKNHPLAQAWRVRRAAIIPRRYRWRNHCH